ncbi:MAG: hypothetical protein Crog4KO_18820 [Crocinitomicaceae bacterium]
MKSLLISLVITCTHFLSLSQNIERGELASLLFNDIYPNGANPTDFEAGFFPTSYLDEGQAGQYEDYIRILSFLEFGDGVPVFDRIGTAFNSEDFISRVEAIKIIIEAYDIPANTTGSLPFNDYNNPDDIYYNQVLTAYNYGIISWGSNLNPYSNATISYASSLMNEADNINVPSLGELYDIDNYFKPFNLSLETMGQFQGIQQGGFSHYAKSSFVIPDVKFSLDFSHFYSNMMVEIPSEFYPIKPLGRGWSHTYNSYITFENNPGGSSDDYYTIVWPDGTIHIYNKDNVEYETKGVYDEFYELGNGNIRITKKDQTRYYYEQFDNGRPIYYLYEIRDRNGNEINIEYENAEENDTRRIEWVEAPSGKKLFFEYQNNTDLIDEITDPIGRDIFFDYSGVTAGWVYQYPVLVAFEDAKGQVTDYSYGINNPYDIHLLNRIELPKGNEILAEYTDNGKLEEYQINNDDPTEVDIDFDYSNQDYESTVEIPTEGGNNNIQDYTFNEYGSITNYVDDNNSLQINYPAGGVNVMLPTNSDMNGVDIDYNYDANGNITQIDKENGMQTESFVWNSDNTLSTYYAPNGGGTNFTYDNNGNLTIIEDVYGHENHFTYDNYGQLETATNQEGIQTVYTYENDGAISTINMPENISHSFLYDGVNRMLQHNNNGLINSYIYDDNDNLVSQTNSMGFTTSFDYDENDNLTEIINANGVSTGFDYDDEDRVIKETFGVLEKEFEYGNEGFLEKYTKPSGQEVNYEYDSDGRLKETGTIANIEYNSRNLIDEITTSSGTTYLNYDALNRLEDVFSVHGTHVEYEYDNSGNVVRIDYPNHNGNQFYVEYEYDFKNRMTEIRTNLNGNETTLVSYFYRHDDLLDFFEYSNSVRGTYFYDNAGRRIGVEYVQLGVPVPPTIFSEDVVLDNRNNIVSQTHHYEISDLFNNWLVRRSGNETYQYDSNNHLTNLNGSNYTIDIDGNTVSKYVDSIDSPGQYTYFGGNVNYTFDIDDRITGITSTQPLNGIPIQFEYNGFDQRVRSEYPNDNVNREFTWDVLNERVIFETIDLGNGPSATYWIYGATGLEAATFPNGGFTYYLGDLRGSVAAMTSSSTAQVGFYKYDDFGKVVAASATGFIVPVHEYRYLGKHGVTLEQAQIGHYNIKARHYDANIGRFLSEDPIWSTNLYPYSENNPMSKIDPDGRNWFNYVESYTDGMNANLDGVDYQTANGYSYGYSSPGLYKTGYWVGFSAQIINEVGGALTARNGAKYVLSSADNTWVKYSNILKSIKSNKGNFGMGKSSYGDALALGKAWVGDGAKFSNDGTILISADGLRQFRLPKYKSKIGRIQANFEWRNFSSGKWIGNGHLDVY